MLWENPLSEWSFKEKHSNHESHEKFIMSLNTDPDTTCGMEVFSIDKYALWRSYLERGELFHGIFKAYFFEEKFWLLKHYWYEDLSTASNKGTEEKSH